MSQKTLHISPVRAIYWVSFVITKSELCNGWATAVFLWNITLYRTALQWHPIVYVVFIPVNRFADFLTELYGGISLRSSNHVHMISRVFFARSLLYFYQPSLPLHEEISSSIQRSLTKLCDLNPILASKSCPFHYNDVIMIAMASQITNLVIVYTAVC